MNPKQSGFTIIEVLVGVIAAILFIGVATVAYTAIKSDEKKTASQSQDTSQHKEIQRGKTYFEFPDLGMKFERTDSNKGMSFRQSKDADGAYLVYDQRLRTLSKQCYGGDQDTSFSTIQRNEGYSRPDNEQSTVAKQFDTFNITSRASNDIQACTDASQQEVFSSRIADLQKQLRYSIQGAEKL